MREAIRYGLILSIICMVAAALLAGVNSLTKSRILSQAQAEENSGLTEVMPSAASFEAVKNGQALVYYRALDKENKSIGVVFKAQAKGYSGIIETLAGMFDDGTIIAIKVVSQNETPGLGTRVTGQDFISRFTNRSIEKLTDVQAITGATISSNAVKFSVKAKAEEIKELLRNGK